MNKKISIRQRKINKRRSKIVGSNEIPRLSIFRSNKYIKAQLIDDSTSKTILYIDQKKFPKTKDISNMEYSYESGIKLGKEILNKKISKIKFDSRWYKYHGKVKKFADGLRKAGVNF